MIYNVNASIICDTVVKRDNIYNTINTFLAGKPVWQNNVQLSKGTDKTGKPTVNLDVRFTQLANKDVLFSAIKTELNSLTGVTARVTKHICYHDNPPKACEIEDIFIK